LQGLEPFDLFIRGFNAVSFFGIIVVEDRRIEARHNNLGFCLVQPPDEQILQQLPEQVDSPKGKCTKEPFHGMR